jgi:2-dehydropantoate 2-reductase
MGAGSVGCWVGGWLAAAGVPVDFVGRARVVDALRLRGLTLTDLDGRSQRLEPAQLQLHVQVPRVRPALVLLCVKNRATPQAARELAAALPGGTVVLSLQNGISAPGVAARAAPGLEWLPGMVPFNVAEIAPGHVHRGSSGQMAARDHASAAPVGGHLCRRRPAAGTAGRHAAGAVGQAAAQPEQPGQCPELPAAARATAGRRAAPRAGGAAAGGARSSCGRPASSRHGWPRCRRPGCRRCCVCRRRCSGCWPRAPCASTSSARSSMADDLAFGRPTEIDALCGEVVRLAAVVGGSAPLNARMAQLVEGWAQDPRPRSGHQLLAALGLD